MIAFLLKASFILATLLLFYKLILERESFFSQNRLFLIFILILSLSIPFIGLPGIINQQGFVSSSIDEITMEVINPKVINVSESPRIEINAVSNSELPQTTTEKPDLSASGMIKIQKPFYKIGFSDRGILFWMVLVYGFGALIFLLHFLSQLLSLFFKIYKTNDIIKDEGYIIINSSAIKEPCSFFNYIFINPASYDYETYEQIIAHEMIHVKKKHSLDLLLSELAIILFWFNPLVWLLRKEIEKNIEYQTDDLVLTDETDNKEQYQLNLVKIATYSRPLTLTTNYNQSLIKQRLLKMNAKKSNPHSLWKYAFILPVTFGLMLLVSKPVSALKTNTATNLTTGFNNTPLVVTTDSINHMLEETAEPLDDKFDITECDAFEQAILNGDIAEVKRLMKALDPDCLQSRNSDQQSKRDQLLDFLSEEFESTNTLEENMNESICKQLKKATKKKQYVRVREILNNEDISCLSMNDDTQSKYLDLIKKLLKNGADLRIGEDGTTFILESHSKKFTWENHSLDKSCLKIKQAALNHDNRKVIELIFNYDADCILDENNEPFDKKYITDLLEAGAYIDYHSNGNFSISGISLSFDFNENKDSEQKYPEKNNVEGRYWEHHNHDNHSSHIDIEEGYQRVETPSPIRLRPNDLMIASARGNLKTVKDLIAKGEDINLNIPGEGTPLTLAVKTGNQDIVEYLIEKEVDVNAICPGVGNALITAVKSEEYIIMEILLNNGADLHQETPANRSANIYVQRSKKALRVLKRLEK